MFCPLYICPVHAGFPSPADDYVESELNLHDYLVKRPAATFFLRVVGDSMRDAGILPGDLLVVDRSVEPVPGKVVVAAINGELTVKRFERRSGRAVLVPANPDHQVIEVGEDDDLVIWGVVVASIHEF